MIFPSIVNIARGEVAIKINKSLAKILYIKRSFAISEIANSENGLKSYRDRELPIRKVIAIMMKNDIQVDEDEAVIILDFLYHIAKTYKFTDHKQTISVRKRRTSKKLIR